MTTVTVAQKQRKSISLQNNYKLNYEDQWKNNSKVAKSPNPVIGKALKFQKKLINQDFPGPGNYNLDANKNSQNKNGVAFSIGKAPKMKTQRASVQIPAPGQYDHIFPENQLKIGSKCSYSFSKANQRENIAKKQGPSPFDYDPKLIINTSASIKIGTSKRNLITLNQNEKDLKITAPSPGSYHLQKINTHKIQPKYSFGKQQKFQSTKTSLRWKTEIPGPSSYQAQKIISNHHIIGGKMSKAGILQNSGQSVNINKRIFQNIQPGPGSYNTVNSFYKRSQRAVIGNSERASPQNENPDKKIIPGPGQYHINNIVQKQRAKYSVMFPKAKRQFLNEDINIKAGPGSYDIKYQMRNSPHAVLTGRNWYNNQFQKPGPQNYSPDYQRLIKSVATASIGKQKRMSQKIDFVPGPSDYYCDNYESVKSSPRSKCYSFTKQRKKQMKSCLVGPGRYQIESMFSSKNHPNQLKKK